MSVEHVWKWKASETKNNKMMTRAVKTFCRFLYICQTTYCLHTYWLVTNSSAQIRLLLIREEATDSQFDTEKVEVQNTLIATGSTLTFWEVFDLNPSRPYGNDIAWRLTYRSLLDLIGPLTRYTCRLTHINKRTWWVLEAVIDPGLRTE